MYLPLQICRHLGYLNFRSEICAHSGKLTRPLKREHFKRKVFQTGKLFGGHVSFRGSNCTFIEYSCWPSFWTYLERAWDKQTVHSSSDKDWGLDLQKVWLVAIPGSHPVDPFRKNASFTKFTIFFLEVGNVLIIHTVGTTNYNSRLDFQRYGW